MGMSHAAESLVFTKLQPLQTHPRLVARPRLTAMLNREPSRKLTLISAPAGFGNSTLLVEWLKERADGEGPVARLSLVAGGHQSASSPRGGHSHGAAGMTVASASSARWRSYHARHKAHL